MIYETIVPVANIWTLETSPRKLDHNILGKDFDLQKWIDLQTYEQKLALCEQNLVQTQVLLGERVIVLEEKNDWMKVVLPEQPSRKNDRGYPGYIPSSQLKRYQATGRKKRVIVSKRTTTLFKNGVADVEISFLTKLALIKEETDLLIVDTPIGQREIKKEGVIYESTLSASACGMKVVNTGMQFLGLAYLWGGMSGFGYDCSGFAYNMYKACGHLLPRDASDQAQVGKNILFQEMEPGDLMFFADQKGQGAVRHVGIYAGEGMMLHSPKTGKEIELISFAGTSYEEEFTGARRYLHA
ncbi:NlpC/P60 family protein [Bacillus sp. NPDC077027]|uniref:C40 family peptidase n=1 Tax=Bacillus sp. NPDC077027 TaxID=3390548 RepID=UPI003CFC3C96